MESRTKDVGDVADYGFDWSVGLARNEDGTIVSSTWEVDPGITVDDDTQFNTTATLLWLSGGVAGRGYKITNTIETTSGATLQRTRLIRVTD